MSLPSNSTPNQPDASGSRKGSRLDRAELQGYLQAAMAPQVIPYEVAVIRPPAALQRRFRPYSMVMPHLSAEPWTLGFDDLAAFQAIVVVVLFTDVAADYYKLASIRHSSVSGGVLMAEKYGMVLQKRRRGQSGREYAVRKP